MNFEDPFANDLSNFRSVAAGLRQGGGGGGGGGGPSVASPLSSSPTTRGGLLGAGSPLMSGGVGGEGRSEASLFPSSSNAPAVAGRRARATPGAASPLSAAPSSVPQSLLSNTPASPFFSSPSPQQTVSAPGAAASPLAWLDDVDPSPPTASRHAGLTPTSAPAAFTTATPLPPTTLAQAAGAGAQAATALPSFLDFDAAGVGGGVAASHQHPIAAAAAGQPQHRNPAVNVVDAAAAEAEQRKKELRDLYATLDALDTEQQRLDERLDTRQLKEEAELLALETSVMTKANELADKEEELATKRAELTTQTASRLDALSKRYRSETEAQAAEVRSLDGVRFEKTLQNVRTQCKAIDETVKGLREQAALAVAMEPFSATGIRVAIAAATSATSADARPAAGAEGGEREEEEEQQQEGVEAPVTLSSSSLDRGLQKAVELLRAYCDERMHHARSQIVDYVHCESLEAAHKVRRGREQSWADDAVAHKTLFSQYMVDMMQRYMVFYKERAALKQQNITSLRAELQGAAAELRLRAAARLQDLLTNVTAKMALSTERQTTSAEEVKRVLHQRMRAVVETDAAAATAQRKELESRLLTEAQARRQCLMAEEHALLEELHRLRRTTETHRRDSFTQLLDTATSSGVDLAQALEEEVAAVKARVAEKVHGDAASLSALRAASSTAHMHSEELLHVIRRSLAAEAAQQHVLTLSHQRCQELRSDLVLRLREDVVSQLQQTRCAQHAHHMRIDAQRKTWEAAHRQNLAAACSLLLPVSGSTAGTADAQYAVETYAAPQDVVSVALLDVLRDRLQGRDASRRHLLQARKAYTTRSLKLLEDVCERRDTVQHTWDELWTAAQTQQAQQHMAHETQLAVETARVNVAAQQQAVERDRRTTARDCRRIAEVVKRLHVEAAQCGVSVEELRAPPEVLEAKSMPFLRTVDAATLNRLPSSASKFTAVHTSTNTAAAHTTESAVAPVAAATDSVSSPNTTTEAPPQLLLPLQSGRGAAAPVATHPGSSVDVADTSNVTATQPWSSALLRAERLLSSSNNAEDLPIPVPQPSGSPAPVVEERHHDRHDGAAGCTTRPERKSTSHSHSHGHSNSSSAPAQLRDVAASASPSTHTEEKHHSSLSSRGRDRAPPPLHMAVPSSPSSWPDTTLTQDTGPQQQPQRQERRRPPSHGTSPWQPPASQEQGRSSALVETWSSLEEFRSAVGRSSSAPHELENLEERGTSFSFDDSTNFVDLLSCTDSPASSHRAY